MFFAKYILKDRILKLTNLEKGIKESQTNIDIEIGRYYLNIYDIRLALEECCCAYARPREYTLMLNFIKTVNAGIKDIKTAEELKESIKSVIDLFMDFDYTAYYSGDLNYSYRSLDSIRGMEVEALDPIVRELDKQSRNFTIFEPYCGQAETMQYIQKDNFLTYVTEPGDDISIAKEHVTKAGKGELKGSKIKNDAFDVIVAKCSIKPTLELNMRLNAISKYEKEFILNVNKYLRPNGIMMFVIPYYRMHKDICEHIAKYYRNVKVVKSVGAYWQEKKYIYIYGQKSDSKVMDQDIYEKLRACMNPDSIEEFNPHMELGFNLPKTHIPIDLFKGSVLDMEELHDIVNHSGALDAFFETQTVEKVGESSTRPLLPFNIGQLGLVLTSGCLDGIIDEGDGHYHLVKGKVSKKSDITSTIEDGRINESETISNRVEINILLPNGEFKTLT